MRPYISSLIVQHEKRLCAFQVIHGWMRSITVLDMLSPHIEDIFQSLNSSQRVDKPIMRIIKLVHLHLYYYLKMSNSCDL